MQGDNELKAGVKGGIEAVVKAINAHINNVDVCEKGCCALKNMTVNNGKITYKAATNKQMK